MSTIISKIKFYKENIEGFDFNKLPKIDAVIHLAAQPSVPLSIENFGVSSCSNLCCTIRIIDYCRINRVPLVYASSSAIYGNLELGDDSSSKTDLLSPYATDKYAMELYAESAYRLYKLPSIGLRFFNVYGPRQDPASPYSGVISIFIDRLLKKKNLIINGGHQTRDFIYVEDVIDAIYKSINTVLNKSLCEFTNILTGNSLSIEQLANMLIKEVGIDVEKHYASLPPGDPEQSNGTTEKMVAILKISLSKMTTIHSGLSKTVNYILNKKNR